METPHLVLFFTRGISLSSWDRIGGLEREVDIYRHLQRNGVRISFVTYGGIIEKEYQELIPGIRILCNTWGLRRNIYEKLIPWLHGPTLWGAQVFKTNQTPGADVALRASRIWRKPLVARCGYMWSALAASGGEARAHEACIARKVESHVFRAAKRVVVTTSEMKNYAVREYLLPDHKVRVIPNHVLTDLFSPQGTQPVKGRLCFVGRFSHEKNPLSLIRACAGLDVELVMVGDGPLKEEIERVAKDLKVALTLIPNTPHRELPKILRSSELFLLASPHEGHPKALLEAMSCGLTVIGVDAPGIREVVKHGENGWLCSQDVSAIRHSIQYLLANPRLREKLGMQAREFVCKHFSREKVLAMELALIREIVRD